jgi:catechol 2,3-dioxygenase-like lactoylglutathione lyase family enzyme
MTSAGRVTSEGHPVTSGGRVTSSLMFVSDLDRSVAFYREVFLCEVTVHAHDAVLLLTPGGFQLYLIARGSGSWHPSGGIGLQCLIWTVDNTEELAAVESAIERRAGATRRFTSAGVTFVGGRDPDGTRVLVAHPCPRELPRSIVDTHLYA